MESPDVVGANSRLEELIGNQSPFGIAGLVLGPLFIVASFEFVGSNEPSGWKLAGSIVPITYIGWSLWLFAIGIALLI